MFVRVCRTAAILAVAASILSSLPATNAQALQPAYQSPGEANVLPSTAVVVYSQPPSPEGGLLLSSLSDPDGSDTDHWAWDNFTLAGAQSITEVRWRGGYDPALLGSGGPVFAFTVDVYASITAGTEPDISHPPLVHYEVGNNANETPAEVLGGVQTYDYQYALPAPFQAAAGTKYWVQIEAFQPGAPDWGLAKAIGGDGYYFRRLTGDGYNYQLVAGDGAFTLLAPSFDGHRVYLPNISSAASPIPLPPSDRITGDAELPSISTARRAPARTGRGR